MKLLERITNAVEHIVKDTPRPLTAEDMINATIDRTSMAQHAITKLETGQSLLPAELRALQWAVSEITNTLEYMLAKQKPKVIPASSTESF